MGITSDYYMSEGSSHSCWGGKDSDDESELEEPSSEDSRMEITEGHGSMNPAIYKAAITGDVNALDDLEASILDQISPQKNTILHIAASRGHDHLVEPILRRRQRLFKLKNSAGDLPIHLAASSGHQSTVQSLISNAIEKDVKDGLMAANKEGNTPLHLALKNRHKEVAKLLFDKNKEASCCLNKEDKSPLYMAVEAGYLHLVTVMITYCYSTKMNYDKMRQGKSIVHAAIETRNKELLDKILTGMPLLMDLIDEHGRRPLSYAASIGYFDGVCYILNSKEFTQSSYLQDRNGFYPVHTASKKGHINIIQEFLRHYLDFGELQDRKGQNILHTAAMNGKANTVRYMLKAPELENLINGRDKNGNTALHLATKKVHPKVVSILSWDKRVSLELLNNRGMTALDIAEDYRGSIPSFQQRLTWQALRYANAPRSKTQLSRAQLKRQSSRTQSIRQPSMTQSNAQNSRTQSNRRRSGNQSSVENYKDRVNTLLLVAILVVTVTFAAGFTMPGEYNGSDPNKGLATMFEKHTFHIFLISNTIAMYSSMAVAVVLIWAQLGDVSLIIVSMKLALPLLGIALTMVSSAFMAGVYLVVSKQTWLANFILIIGSLFLLAVMVLFVPLFLPSSLNHHVLRYIFYYPFYILVLVTESNADENSTK
ncbi:hypothetical protein F0562_010866 [Nyssa sinensis]|uniref:PGG domain-containing protein n=1 Tax=Nyssa sinensis TaxID=561372 RepID=A0A5J5A1S4_9ASTE|nr:hypothetical protein F0562_010866 [Nyssa sinensis]